MTRSAFVVINTDSGSVPSDAEQQFSGIAGSSGLGVRRIVECAGCDLEAALGSDDAQHADLLVGWGGDGTLRSTLMAGSRTKTPVLLLPGGTMNMLVKTLYQTDDWRQVLQSSAAHPQFIDLDAGVVDDEPYFVAAMFGLLADMGLARETGRKTGFIEGVREAAQTLLEDEEKHSVWYRLLDSGNNPQNRQHATTVAALISQGKDVLELTSSNDDIGSTLISAGWHALVDDWRESMALKVVETTVAEVAPEDGNETMQYMLDGEHRRASRPVRLTLAKGYARVMVGSER